MQEKIYFPYRNNKNELIFEEHRLEIYSKKMKFKDTEGHIHEISIEEIEFLNDYFEIHCILKPVADNFIKYRENSISVLCGKMISTNIKAATKKELIEFLNKENVSKNYNFDWLGTIIASECLNIQNSITVVFSVLSYWSFKDYGFCYYSLLKNSLINNVFSILQSFIRLINISFLISKNKLDGKTEKELLDKIWLVADDDLKMDINKNFYTSFTNREIEDWKSNYDKLTKIRNIIHHPTKKYPNKNNKEIGLEYYMIDYFPSDKKLKYKYIKTCCSGKQTKINDDYEFDFYKNNEKYDVFEISIFCLKLLFKHLDSYN